MRSDRTGVAGFFEDLPVLMFVLAGTCVLVASGVLASEANAQKDQADRLHRLASRLADSLMTELYLARPGLPPSVSAVCATALEQVADAVAVGCDYYFSLLVLHPELRYLCNASNKESCAGYRAASASRLVNASTDDGLVAILVVKVVVW